MFIGKIPGTIGEVSVIALLIGAQLTYADQEGHHHPDSGGLLNHLCCLRVYFRRTRHGFDIYRLLTYAAAA